MTKRDELRREALQHLMELGKFGSPENLHRAMRVQKIMDDLLGPDAREGVMMVFRPDGSYAGCIGEQTWQEQLNAP